MKRKQQKILNKVIAKFLELLNVMINVLYKTRTILLLLEYCFNYEEIIKNLIKTIFSIKK